MPASLALAAPRYAADPACWAPSTHEVCPLCGLGEASSEHLLQWCPAVTEAWNLCGGRGDLGQALGGRSLQDEIPRKVLHLTPYLHHAVH
eukprot:9942318-Lingulodinium_polyedra.AAC.1